MSNTVELAATMTALTLIALEEVSKTSRNRFEIERNADGWQINDYFHGTYLSCESRQCARDALRFARAYVERHGDIDFGAFPHDLDSELRYDEPEHATQTRPAYAL